MKPGTCGWIDLTVKNAETVRDFYSAVVGWAVQDVPMKDAAGAYTDYAMIIPGESNAAGGVCHARGVNATLPPVWMPYFTVADLDQSLTAVTKQGGTVLRGPESMGPWGRAAWIKDPAGAVCCIVQPPPGKEG
jgi:uncharacterized protein